MTALLDLNVLLDVIQNRQPFYAHSAAVLSAARVGEFKALLPNHAITTVFYLVERSSKTNAANETVDWLLKYFDVPAADKSVFLRARALPFNDFEDAVVASIAEKHNCDFIVTRNAEDFAQSPVQAIAPPEFLSLLQLHT